MIRLGSYGCAAIIVAGAVAVAAATPARASVISSTPTLPLLGVPYVTAASASCFPLAGVCVTGGVITFTSLVSSMFNAAGQDITTEAVNSVTLTNLSHVPIGTIDLSGTVEQEVLGRTSPTELGSWTTDLISLSLSGTVLGHTLTIGLDPAHESTGETSIVPFGNNGHFEISSFFDVFVELTLDSVPPLHTTREVTATAVQSVPEPSSIAAIAAALAMMPVLYRRRSARFPKIRIM